MKRDIAQWSSNDLFELWCLEFQKKYNTEYVVYGYIGNDKHKLKEMIDMIGPYGAAIAVVRAIRAGDKAISKIDYTELGPQSTLPSVEYKILTGKPPRPIKEKWSELIKLESRWLPDAKHMKRREELKKELLEWAFG